MLTLSRYCNERVTIGPDIEVRIADIRGDVVRLGITAPQSLRINRYSKCGLLQSTAPAGTAVQAIDDHVIVKAARCLVRALREHGPESHQAAVALGRLEQEVYAAVPPVTTDTHTQEAQRQVDAMVGQLQGVIGGSAHGT